jgi:hypothetical protein
MASIYNDDKVLLFGGLHGSNYITDTWVFDLSDNNWTEKKPQTSPSQRAYVSEIAGISGTDNVLLFGGWDTNYKNDTWIYNLTTNTWTDKTPATPNASNNPSSRYHYAMAPISTDDKVVIFGGVSFPSNNETWVYDLSANKWTDNTPVNPTPTNNPSRRHLAGMAPVWGTDKVVMFGGGLYTAPLYSNETWLYDLGSNTWTEIAPMGSSIPSARRACKMASIWGTDQIIMFGGLSDIGTGYLNDTWVFDLSEQLWTEKFPINPENKPCMRSQYAMATVNGTDKVVLFGGRASSSNYFDDTWIYFHFAKIDNGTFISEPHDNGANSSFNVITWDADTPAGTSVRIQLRSAGTKSGLNNTAFIGPDGSESTFYTSTPANIWPGHYGDRWIQYKAYLNSSNFTKTPNLQDITITYNCLPESIIISPVNGSTLNTSKPTFFWIFEDLDSDKQNEFQLLIDDEIGFQNIDYNSNAQNSVNNYWQFPNGTSYLELPDGKYYWKVRTKDSDGDWGLYSAPFKFIIDTGMSSTEIIIPKNNTYYSSIEIIYGIALEEPNGTGLKKVEIQIENLNAELFWNGSAFTTQKCWLIPEGIEIWSYNTGKIKWVSGTTYKIRSRAFDNAGNIETPAQSKSFTFDNDEVIFSNPNPLPTKEFSTGEVEVGITISDNTSGVNVSNIKYSTSINSGETWSSWKSVEGFQNGKIVDIKLNLTFPNGTENRIRWRAYDIAGNGPSYSDEYVINVNIVQEPILPEIQLLAPENNSVIKTTSIELNWDILKLGSKKAKFDIYLDTENPPMDVVQENYTELSLIINDLEDGNTYYWSVIPKIDGQVGTCISGVWSFSVKIPTQMLPKVKLKTPTNGSTIQSILPTLVWELEYVGGEKIDYAVYIGTLPNPGLRMDKVPATHFSINEQLSDNTTYYWYVVPYAGGLTGFSSEVWSFTVKLKDEQIPEFGINLYLNPNPLEIKPGEVKFLSAIVTNLGEQKDNFTVIIGNINNTKLTAENYRQDTLEIEPGMNKEFLIMISVEDNTKPGFENITITATSRLAEKYNFDVQYSQVLTIKILEIDEQNGKERGQPISIFYFSILLLIIILIIISIIILFIVRKKSSKKESEVMESQDIVPKTPPEKITIHEPETTGEPLPVVTEQQDETLEE